MIRLAALGACLAMAACASGAKSAHAPKSLNVADAMVAYRFCLGAESNVAARCEAERKAFYAAASWAAASAADTAS